MDNFVHNAANKTSEFLQYVVVENNAPFSMLLGKPWIEGDQARRKEEEILEHKKQELKDFMTRKITHVIEEHENISNLLRTKDLDVEVGITLEDPQKTEVPIPDTDEILPLISRKEYQQREVTLPKEDTNQNGKRNSEMKLTEKKARKLSKKRDKIEKLQKVLEGTSQKENLQNWNFVGISELRHMALHHGNAI
jgi:hypothetical protein